MSEEFVSFSDLGASDEQRARWLKERDEAIRYVSSLNGQKALQQLAEQFDSEFKKKKKLPDYDELPARASEFARAIGLPSKEVDSNKLRQTVVITRALGLFLSKRKPSRRRLAAVASVEFYLDVPLLAQTVALGRRAKAWRTALARIKLEPKTINDDAYFASDEVERWAKEVQNPVPSWHAGNFPRMERSSEFLISAILRELDEQEWLKFMDRLPLPMITESLLWAAQVQHEPSLLLRWLASAPPVFSDDGHRNSSSLAFVLERQALRLLEDTARNAARWDSSEKDREEEVARLKPACRELAETLRGRPDGAILLAELAARLLRMESHSRDQSPHSMIVGELHYALAAEYLEQLGGTRGALELLRKRALVTTDRGAWCFWLCSVVLVLARRGADEKSDELLRSSWVWLSELLIGRDPQFKESYLKPAQWTHRLAGLCLAANDDPGRALETIWSELAAQRTKQRGSDYENDMWATSRFAVIGGYFACHAPDDLHASEDLWTSCMDMSISAWFSGVTLEPFEEVIMGVAHLAKAPFAKTDPLKKVFEYLVGLPREVARVAVIAVQNGMAPSEVSTAATHAGIELHKYLSASTDPRLSEAVADLLANLSYPSPAVIPAQEPQP